MISEEREKFFMHKFTNIWIKCKINNMEKLPNNRIKENFIAKNNVPENEKNDLETHLRRKQYRSKDPISEREIEKTLENLELINLANKSVIEAIKNLGLEVPMVFDPIRVHIIPADFQSRTLENNQGQYQTIEDRIIVRKQKDNLQFYKVMVHELLHAYSWNKFYIKETKEGFRGGAKRSGYSYSSKENEDEMQFQGLTEAIIEDFQREITYHHAEDLTNLTTDDKNVLEIKALNWNAYTFERDLLHYAIDRLAKENNLEINEIRQKLRKGLFTGEMMFLRIFEKTFGPDTLKILAKFGGIGQMEDEEVYEQFKQYFDSPSEQKEEIVKILLGSKI